MAEQDNNKQLSVAMKNVLQDLQKNGDFDIRPCDAHNIEDNPKYKKLEMTTGQKMKMSAFAGQLPSMAAALGSASALSAARDATYYVMTVPNGMPYTLMQLKDGGFGNTIRGLDGKFAGQLPLYPLELTEQLAMQTAVLTTFSAMSVATGQYFLSQINNKLNAIKTNLDDILKFLYGDKKAELMSEVNFVCYVYQNYNAIMSNEAQKIATISSLQEARKIAIKDCEFYLNDLKYIVERNKDINEDIPKIFDIHKALDLAMNLYVTSSVLEAYYAQNFDTAYLTCIEKDVLAYLRKCEKNILDSFVTLRNNIHKTIDTPFFRLKDREKRLEQVNATIESLHNSEESEIRKTLASALHMPTNNKTYYISSQGEVYIKSA